MKTKLGQIVITHEILDEIGNNPDFAIFILDCLEKYELFQDWVLFVKKIKRQTI